MTHLTIPTKVQGPKVAPDLYGLFFEDINRAADSGLYPEMLRNRSFEDSIEPIETTQVDNGDFFVTKEGYREQFFRGEGTALWASRVEATDVPAWYTVNAVMELQREDTLHPNRMASLKVAFEDGGKLFNIGYTGVPAVAGAKSHFYAFIKAEKDMSFVLQIAGEKGVYGSCEIEVKAGDYTRYDADLICDALDGDARFEIIAKQAGTAVFGFTSLMPTDTYHGHGLRTDLMELLRVTNSRFLRFPGGCIVEGLNKDTAMRFSDTVGPVWTRPGKWNLWHYRATNGLGFHEYLQLCEDLNLEALYVVNCGMTCQGRGPEFFLGEELDAFLQETYDAMEYATGDVSTKWGALRAEMGHPEPFRIKYLEIGNENDGPEYDMRYEYFYEKLSKRYPDVILISNAHTERRGLPTQIVDEHYYNDLQFFFQSGHLYDAYDKKGPQVFLGEYAVTRGQDVGTLHSALSEAAFMMGCEHNPEVVTLASYAPLFENVHYPSWNPNLIRFDNYRSCGIPSCYALGVLGADRGEYLVKEGLKTDTLQPVKYGFPGFIAYENGVTVKEMVVDGVKADISKQLTGNWIEKDGALVSDDSPNFARPNTRYPVTLHMTHCVLNEEQVASADYSVKVFVDENTPKFAITVWTHNTTEPGFRGLSQRRWNLAETEQYSWTVDGTKGRAYYLYRYQEQPLCDSFDLPIRMGEYNEFRVVTDETGYDCYLNGVHVQRVQDRTYGRITSLVQQDDEYIYVKLLNASDREELVTMDIDVPVEKSYRANLLTGDVTGFNTLEEPTKVAVQEIAGEFGDEISYLTPAWSITGLVIKKA